MKIVSFSTALLVALLSAGVDAVIINNRNQLDAKFNFGDLVNKGAAGLTKLAGGDSDLAKQIKKAKAKLEEEMDDVKGAAKSGDLSKMISESADLGKLAGAKKLSSGMKNISGEMFFVVVLLLPVLLFAWCIGQMRGES